MSDPSPPEPAIRAVPGRAATGVLLGGVGLVALATRLVPVLRGGGLHGLGNYDDAVHFAAAAGLVAGQLPYRDFLLLQPPGIVLLLSPYALLGRLVGDPDAFALARLAWMVVGALTAGLVGLLLRRLGLLAMLTGGLAYALFFPVSYVERTTLQEGPQNTLLVLALLLLGTEGRAAGGRRVRPLVAGLALGLLVTIKIWGVATVLVVLLWLLLARRFRDAVVVAVGAAALAAAGYLVFFVRAPAQMWAMVVTDQLGRRWTGTLRARVAIETGLSPDGSGRAPALALAVAVAVLLGALVLAWYDPLGRLAVALYLVSTVVLVATPSAFLHYGALVGAPTAIVLGCGAAALAGRSAAAGWRRPVAGAAALLTLVGLGADQPGSTFGSRFHPGPIDRVLAGVPGCVTFDDPGPALQLDVIRRNLARGCPLVIDLGGRSYHPPMIADVSRARNRAWQTYAIDYLSSGDATLIHRFRSSGGFSAATRATVRSWPLLVRSGPVDLRRPVR